MRLFRSDEKVNLTAGLKLRFELGQSGTTTSVQSIKFVPADAVSPEGNDFIWRDHITLVDVPAVRFNGNTWGSAVFKDTMTHVRQPYLLDGPLTSVHESMHFILHENDGRNPGGGKFIYAGDGKGAFWPESTVTTGQIEPSIPRAIAATGKLYNTYIRSRPSQVLGENIFDEWLAYITETYSLIESDRAGNKVPNDSVEGSSSEFLYYCATAMHVIYTKDPKHLEKQNVKAIFAMLAERTRWLVDNLPKTPGLTATRTLQLYEHLRTNADSQAIRDSLQKIYGPIWTQRVLGF